MSLEQRCVSQRGGGVGRGGFRGFIPLPDSLPAAEGAARSWGRAETAEGGGAFSQSPGQQGRGQSRAERAEHYGQVECVPHTHV